MIAHIDISDYEEKEWMIDCELSGWTLTIADLQIDINDLQFNKLHEEIAKFFKPEEPK